MKKETDRTRRWRARKKAEGKSSFTVLLSREAKAILTEEKAKTGESYSVIVDKALHVLKKHGYRSSVFKPFPKLEDIPATVLTNNSQPPVVAEKKTESGGKQRILIDDLANYPTEDVKRDYNGTGQDGIYDFKYNEGIISRLLRSSTGFRRRKKWFK